MVMIILMVMVRYSKFFTFNGRNLLISELPTFRLKVVMTPKLFHDFYQLKYADNEIKNEIFHRVSKSTFLPKKCPRGLGRVA